MFIDLWVGSTVEASARETVVYRSIEKVLFTGTTHNISSEVLQCSASFLSAAAEHS